MNERHPVRVAVEMASGMSSATSSICFDYMSVDDVKCAMGSFERPDLLKYAAKHGYADILERNGWCEDVFDHYIDWHAVNCGHMNILEWIDRNAPHPKWSSSLCATAARRGDLEMLKWLRARGSFWDIWTVGEAQMHGHAHVLEWLADQDPPCPGASRDE